VTRDVEYEPCTLSDIRKQLAGNSCVAVGINGRLMPDDTWVKPGDTVTLVPKVAGGEGARSAAFIGLAIASFGFGGAIAGSLSGIGFGGIGFAGTTTMGVAAVQAGIIVGGGMLVNALLPPDMPPKNTPQGALDWALQTTQRAGATVPVFYGQMTNKGNVLMAYTETTNTETALPVWISWFTQTSTIINGSSQAYNLLLGLGDGPNEGIVSGTVKLNDKPLSAYTGVTTEEKKGTLNQSAISLWSEQKVEFRINEPLTLATPYVYTTSDANYDELEAEFLFPNGLTGFTKKGNNESVKVRLKVEISEASAGSWSTLVDKTISCATSSPVRFAYRSDTAYTGGSPVTINNGTQYDVRFTLVSRSDLFTDNVRWDAFAGSVRQIYNDAQAYPRTALYAIQAVNSDDLSGVIQFSCEYKGRVVRVYDDGTSTWSIEWSDNPAWVAYDILTQPVISGDGGGTPYAVARYDGIDPNKLVLQDFVDYADFCDTLVNDGAGGTEKRYTFNAILDREQSIWDAANTVFTMSQCKIVPNGDKYRLVIDQAVNPVYEFTVANMLQDSFQLIGLDQEQRASVIQIDYQDENQDYAIVPLRVAFTSAGNINNKVRWPARGITSQTEAQRLANHLLYSNAFIKKLASWEADVDAIAAEVGDVVYMTHDAISTTNQGGAVINAGSDWIEVDFEPTASGGTDKVLIQVYDTTLERDVLTEHTVAILAGNVINVSIPFDPDKLPARTNKLIYGPSTVTSEKWRITNYQMMANQRVRITATQYAEAVYTSADGAPVVPVDASLSSPLSSQYTQQPLTRGDLNTAAGLSDVQVVSGGETADVIDVLFESAGGGAIKWEAQRGTAAGIVVYGEQQYWIQPDAVGTTDTYIYIDTNLADPSVLQTSNAASDYQADGKFLMCINNAGTPIPINGLKTQVTIGSTTWATLDDIPDGVTYRKMTIVNADILTDGSDASSLHRHDETNILTYEDEVLSLDGSVLTYA
jgi:sulfur carrier protein ThiS